MTTLIKNVNIVDGSGQPSYKADIVVRGDRIVAIGSFAKYNADEIIDGMGAYLTPGFIDTNNLSDTYLTIFNNPNQKDFLEQGVTTIMGGQYGISLAPVFYGKLNLHNYFANTSKLNVGWYSVSSLLNFMSKRKFGVNFGTFVGYATLRHEIVGDDFRDLTAKELELFEHTLTQSLRAGAYGLSIDLSFPLTSLTQMKEIKSLAEIVKKFDAVLSIRIRNSAEAEIYLKQVKDHFLPSVQEIISLASETGVKVQLTNFICPKGLEKEYKKALKIFVENSAACDISVTYNTSDYSLLNLFSLLPIWARRGGLNEIGRKIDSNDILKKIKSDLPNLKGDEIIIFDIPGHKVFSGKTLKQFSDDRELSIKDGLIELLKVSKVHGSVLYKNVSNKIEKDVFDYDKMVLGSAAASFGNVLPAANLFDYGKAFADFIFKVLHEKIMPIEAAVNKITGMPAQRFLIKDRGLVREGYFADLLLFRDDGKIELAMVNGKIVLKDEHILGENEGVVLKRVSTK